MYRAFLGAFFAIFLVGNGHAADATDTQKPTDSHIAAALDLLEANHTTDNMTAALDALAPLQTALIQRENPSMDPKQVIELEVAVRAELLARMDEYKRMAAEEYAAHFSEDELHTLAAFYRSDVGKKYIGTIPVLIKELGPVESKWALDVARDAAAKVQKKPLPQGDHT